MSTALTLCAMGMAFGFGGFIVYRSMDKHKKAISLFLLKIVVLFVMEKSITFVLLLQNLD